jgi:hypothetical protein
MEQTSVKKCKTCGEPKPLDCFYRHNDNADGKQNDCKTCYKNKVKAKAKSKKDDPLRAFYF